MTDNSEHQDEGGAWLSPTLAPIGFAAGLILILIGLVTDFIIFGVGVAIAVIAGFFWVYTVSTAMRHASSATLERSPLSRIKRMVENWSQPSSGSTRSWSSAVEPSACSRSRHTSSRRRCTITRSAGRSKARWAT